VCQSMKKKFASFLLTGKAATLPFLSNNVSADVDVSSLLFDDQQQHLIERPTSGNQLLNYGNGGLSMQRVFPGQNCTFAEPSADTSFVITGLRNGDYVYLATSADSHYQPFMDDNPGLTIGITNLAIISEFQVQGDSQNTLPDFFQTGGDLQNATFSIAIPINFDQISSDTFFTQAVIIRDGQQLVTELDEVRKVTADCDSYGSIVDNGSYGGNSGGSY
jgi:hypothetical protein